MNEWEMLQRTAERLRKNYPPGTRVRLIQMGRDPYPVPPRTEGTVVGVDDAATIHVHWDNGSGLGLIWGEDAFEKIPEQTETEQDPSEENTMGGPVL